MCVIVAVIAVTKDMNLQPNCGSDRAWVWKADDYADEAIKTETLAIRFANAESEYFNCLWSYFDHLSLYPWHLYSVDVHLHLTLN